MDFANMTKREAQEFMELPVHIRADVELWVGWLREVELAKPILPVIESVANKSGVNVSSVYRKRRAFNLCGWRGLINRAKWPSTLAQTSEMPFQRFLHGLWLANSRHYKNTHRHLMAIWKARAPIPGYDYPPQKWRRLPVPQGWTYCNMIYHIKTFMGNFPSQAGERIGLAR
jgi:hypothetical protein